jgi:NAD(P)-dependent dehydrogenase (short-subunit alcohol dehydrogenase family)
MSRSVLITGANTGIGLVTALHLAEHGWDVIGTVRSAAKADRVHTAADERGLAVRTIELEISDADDCERAVAEAVDMCGRLYGLVNNAGFAQTGAVEDVSDDDARRQLEINLVAPARLSRLVLPHFRDAGGGRIVNISSMAGRFALPLGGWYSASKFGLEALSDAMRVEVADFGVQVVLVEPGSFRSEIWSRGEDALPEPSHEAYARAYSRSEMVFDNERLMPDPIWVGRTIRRALESPTPRARYLVGVDAIGGVVAQTLVPTRLLDIAKAASTGFGVGRMLRPHSPPSTSAD